MCEKVCSGEASAVFFQAENPVLSRILPSAMLALPIIDRVLLTLLPDDKQRRVVIRSMALEGILGHMGTTTK